MPDTPLLTLLRALGEETRLRLSAVLLEHELNVAELTAVFGMGQSRVSRHLKVLADAGLVEHRRDGQWTFYTAAASGSGYELLTAVRSLMRQDEGLQADMKRTERVIEERTRDRARFFDSLAQGWSRMRAETLSGVDLEHEVLARMKPCETALDMGCGAGDMLPVLAGKARTVIGVDSAAGMLDECRKRHGRLAGRLSLRLGELEYLPLREGEADFALAGMVLHHLFEPLRGVEEAFRVLSPGGQLVVVEFGRHAREDMRKDFGDRWLGFEPEKLEGWLRTAGFDVKERAELRVDAGLPVHVIVAHKPK